MRLTFYTTNELAALLGVHPRRITNMVAAGVISCVRDEQRRMLFNINHVMAALWPDRAIGNRPRAWKPPEGAQPLDLDTLDAQLKNAPRDAQDSADLEDEGSGSEEGRVKSGAPDNEHSGSKAHPSPRSTRHSFSGARPPRSARWARARSGAKAEAR